MGGAIGLKNCRKGFSGSAPQAPYFYTDVICHIFHILNLRVLLCFSANALACDDIISILLIISVVHFLVV